MDGNGFTLIKPDVLGGVRVDGVPVECDEEDGGRPAALQTLYSHLASGSEEGSITAGATRAAANAPKA
jgi:hypothetical protein